MSNGKPKWRIGLEIAIISAIAYIFLGAPGIQKRPPSPSQAENSQVDPATDAWVKQLVSPSKNLQCPQHDYTTHIFSTKPLILYIDNFLSTAEADHLVALSASRWQPSTILNNGVETTDPSIRRSDRARLPRGSGDGDGDVVRCIEQRALALQGWPRHCALEQLWSQRYNVSGHYALHHDWAAESAQGRRVSSFMVYLDDACVGGGTHFPRLPTPRDERWCRFVECGGAEGGDGAAAGVTFRARKGSAVFWMNFDADGKGYRETIHAGLPVTEGTKIGLNIWTWFQAGYEPPEEE